MSIIRKFWALAGLLAPAFASAQIMLSPVIDSSIPGLTDNNVTIVENRLQSIINSNGMVSGYGGRFVLACRVAALDREVSGSKLIQRLEVTFFIGDNMSNASFGSTSTECTGIGNTEGQAMTNALKSIRGNSAGLKGLIMDAQTRIMDYYEQNGSAIIQRAKALLAGEEWEEALFELTAIPQECSSYPQAAKLMGTVYTAHINHDAAQTLAEARAVWSADPNPGPSADKAMEILSGINTSASCYPQAKALMERIEARVKSVTDREYKNEVDMEKARINAETSLEKARINACREIAVAYAKRKVTVQNYYRYW